jgi:NAD(P)-dependent dehydrogenase (short-subunit alcohol dehydrogenase family)
MTMSKTFLITGVSTGLGRAFAPLETSLGRQSPQAFRLLKQDLAIVVSAEALFTLTDLYELSPDESIASAVRAARTITAAAVGQVSTGAQAQLL